MSDTQDRLVTLPLDLIDPAPDNIRNKLPDMDDMAISVEKYGILQPPTVTLIEGGRYQIAMGHRRIEAARMVGLVEALCIVTASVEDRQRIGRMFAENFNQSPPTPDEEAEGYIRMRDEFDMTPQEIAEQTGRSITTVISKLSWYNLPKDLWAAMVSGTITQAVTTQVASEFTGEGGAHNDAVNQAWEYHRHAMVERDGMSPLDALLVTLPENQGPSALQIKSLVVAAVSRAEAVAGLAVAGVPAVGEFDSEVMVSLAEADPQDLSDVEDRLLVLWEQVLRLDDVPELLRPAKGEPFYALAIIDNRLVEVIHPRDQWEAALPEGTPAVELPVAGKMSVPRAYSTAVAALDLLTPADLPAIIVGSAWQRMSDGDIAKTLLAMGVDPEGDDPRDVARAAGIKAPAILAVHALVKGLGLNLAAQTALRTAGAPAEAPETPESEPEVAETPESEPEVAAEVSAPPAEAAPDLMDALKASVAKAHEPEPEPEPEVVAEVASTPAEVASTPEQPNLPADTLARLAAMEELASMAPDPQVEVEGSPADPDPQVEVEGSEVEGPIDHQAAAVALAAEVVDTERKQYLATLQGDVAGAAAMAELAVTLKAQQTEAERLAAEAVVAGA